MATKPGRQSQRERPAKLRQPFQLKFSDHPLLPSMTPTSLTEASMMETSATDMSELVREVTQNMWNKWNNGAEVVETNWHLGQNGQQPGRPGWAHHWSNHSRRDNNWILNLKEGMEGEHLFEFFESWLPTKVGLSATKGHIKLDRVHRTTRHANKHGMRNGPANSIYTSIECLWWEFLYYMVLFWQDYIQNKLSSVNYQLLWRKPWSSSIIMMAASYWKNTSKFVQTVFLLFI